MNKEQWIEDILNSAGELKNNRLKNDLLNSILLKINTNTNNINNIKLRWISIAAIVLIFMNISSVLHAKTHKNKQNNNISILADELNANNNYNY